MNKHTFILTVCTLIALLLLSCASSEHNRVVPSAKSVKITYNQSDFNSITADMQANVDITTGKEFSVTATVPENISDYFIVKKNGNTLHISCKQIEMRQAAHRTPPTIYVTLPELASLTTSDQSSISVRGNVGANFTIRSSDQSIIDFCNNLSANSITLRAEDQSVISADNISVKYITISTEDQSSVDIENLTATNGTIVNSDQSSLSVKSRTGDIKVKTTDQASYSTH